MHAFMSNLPLSLIRTTVFPREIGDVDIHDAPAISVVTIAEEYARRIVLRFPNSAENKSWITGTE